jgi:hypothetical protein
LQEFSQAGISVRLFRKSGRLSKNAEIFSIANISNGGPVAAPVMRSADPRGFAGSLAIMEHIML